MLVCVTLHRIQPVEGPVLNPPAKETCLKKGQKVDPLEIKSAPGDASYSFAKEVDWNNGIFLQAPGKFQPLEALKAIDKMIESAVDARERHTSHKKVTFKH